MKFSKLSAAVFDMDGVLWRGDQPLDGLHELFDLLRERSIPYMLATNNSSKTPADYVQKLTKLGVEDVPQSAIITSATATAAYLQKHYPAGTRIFVVGMTGLQTTLLNAGFDVVNGAETPEVELVVAGADFNLTYDTLKRATLYIRNGATFIGTNPDRTFPAPEGLVPGAGSILAALEAATDVIPLTIGKPKQPMFESALETLGFAAEDVVMVGDRISTDIEGAQVVGMQTILLFTGVTQPEDLILSAVQPDVAYEDLPSLVRAWAGDAWWVAKQRERRKRS